MAYLRLKRGPEAAVEFRKIANHKGSNQEQCLACGSRDELVVEGLATAFKDLDVWEEHTADIAHLLQNYPTEAHRAMRREPAAQWERY